jgi:glucokinase-like ROK family protein
MNPTSYRGNNNIRGSNINLVKAHNMRAILLRLLHDGSVSRVELAEKTSLSSTTITNLTGELLDLGIVVEERVETSERPRRVGRPRRMLRILPSARYAVGVHIGIGTFRVAITDLFADVVCNKISTYAINTDAAEVLADIGTAVDEIIAESNVDRDRIIGVGIGASGLVDYEKGINIHAPRLGWKNIPIRELMERRLALPVCVDNNVRAMALGEAYFGAGRGVGVLAFVYGRIGVGAGFVLNGQLFRGGSAGAGEIGHTTMLTEGGELCTCGNRGCLETLLSEPVWVRQAKAIAQKFPEGLLAQTLKPESESKPIEQIFAAARDGDHLTREMIEESACYLGVALANLVNVLNPELILLGGLFAQGDDMIVPVAEKVMRETAFAGLGEKVQVKTTSFGWRAGVVGAAALALMTYLYQQPEGS